MPDKRGPDNRGSTVLCMLILSPIQNGSTPLYQASFAGKIDEVKKLLEGGTNVNEANDVSLILNRS